MEGDNFSDPSVFGKCRRLILAAGAGRFPLCIMLLVAAHDGFVKSSVNGYLRPLDRLDTPLPSGPPSVSASPLPCDVIRPPPRRSGAPWVHAGDAGLSHILSLWCACQQMLEYYFIDAVSCQ